MDESGFTLTPPVPYAWQAIGETLGIPSRLSPSLNILGFLHRQGHLDSYVSEQSITSDVVVACIETFFPTCNARTKYRLTVSPGLADRPQDAEFNMQLNRLQKHSLQQPS